MQEINTCPEIGDLILHEKLPNRVGYVKELWINSKGLMIGINWYEPHPSPYNGLYKIYNLENYNHSIKHNFWKLVKCQK